MFVGLPLYLFGFFVLNFPLYDINNYILYITLRDQFMGNLFKKSKSAVSGYLGSVSGDANAIKSQLKGKVGGMSAISNTFDQRISDGLSDLLTGATGIRTSNIPEISAEVMQGKSKNREARAKVLNDAMGGRPGATPATGVKLQFPENFVAERGISGEEASTMTNYIHFRSIERQNREPGEEVYDIFLYVPDELGDDIALTYESQEKGLLEGIVGKIMGTEDTVGTGKSELMEMLKSNAPGSSILKQAAGKTMNPLKFQLFQGVDFRTYSYSFTLRPKNAAETATIKEMIYAFKVSSLPGTTGTNSRIYTFPNEWAIRYHGPIRDYVELPMVCVCSGVTVDYAPDSFVHNIDGSPVAIDLKVDFAETSTLDRTKFKARVTPFGNEGTFNRENTQEGGSDVVGTAEAAEIRKAHADRAAADAEAKAAADAAAADAAAAEEGG
jgi:hypothetical protein